MKLPDRLGRRSGRPFHSAIATSFALEFAAVEEILLPQLMASGATNLLLLTDARMTALALADGSTLPAALGRDYALYSPPAANGIFHPKIILQIGRESARAIVSSANLTASGLAGNAEVAVEIECKNTPSPEQDIIRSIWTHSCPPPLLRRAMRCVGHKSVRPGSAGQQGMPCTNWMELASLSSMGPATRESQTGSCR